MSSPEQLNKTIMEWKDIVVKFYALKKHSLTFKASLYDYVYISSKKSVGIITEIMGESIFTVAFFPSMKNEKTFAAVINFDRARDFIIPRYENLFKYALSIVHKSDGSPQSGKNGRFLLHDTLAGLYKHESAERTDFDMLLFFICDWLGLREIYEELES